MSTRPTRRVRLPPGGSNEDEENSSEDTGASGGLGTIVQQGAETVKNAL